MFGIASRLGIAPYVLKVRERLIRPKAEWVEIAPGKQSAAFYEAIKRVCSDAGLPAFFDGGRLGAKRVHVKVNDIHRFNGLLANIPKCTEIAVRARGRIQPLRRPRGPDQSYDLLIEEARGSGGRPTIFASPIRIHVWKPLTTYSTEALLESAQPTPHFGRLRESTFNRFAEEHRDFDEEPYRDVFIPNFEVDVVYTWVDDSDPAWREKREHYARLNGREGRFTAAGRSMLSERHRNRDELRYSLRSLESFAPFVRKIWLVTDDQVPAWLNPSDKICLVSHRDIFRDGTALPSFNSSGIETQLHHIDGLAERFLYFNDDFFLGRLCSIADFFHANGVIKFFPSDQRANENDIDDSREEYLVADKNAIELFKRDFGFVGRLLMQHVPYPSNKSLLHELEEKYQAEFDECAAQRFRSGRDVRPIAFMQYPYGVYRGCAVRDRISHRYLALWKPVIEAQLESVARRRRHKTFCINDVGLTEERRLQVDQAVLSFLDAYFPLKSRFEK